MEPSDAASPLFLLSYHVFASWLESQGLHKTLKALRKESEAVAPEPQQLALARSKVDSALQEALGATESSKDSETPDPDLDSGSDSGGESGLESDSDSDSGSESGTESSSEDEGTKAKRTGAATSNVVLPQVDGTVAISSSSDSGSSSKSSSSSSSSDSNSDSSSSSSSDSNSDSSSSSSSSESDPTSSSSSSSSSSSDSSSESASDAEPAPPTKRRKLSPASSKTAGAPVSAPNQASASAEVLKPSVDNKKPRESSGGGRKNGSKAPNQPFRRIKHEEVQVDSRFADNSFLAKGGAKGSYGYKAHQDLITTRGVGFTKQKNKMKKGSYRGGQIDMQSHSIKFPD